MTRFKFHGNCLFRECHNFCENANGFLVYELIASRKFVN